MDETIITDHQLTDAEKEEWKKRFDAMALPVYEAGKTLQDRVYDAIPMTDDLSETTKVMLKGIIDRLAMLSRLDMSDVCALSILAIEYDKVLRATAAMATEDLITNGKRNPLLAVATASENTVLSLIKEFGLSTKSRKTLNERDTAPRKSNKLEGYDNPELPFGQDT